MNNITLIETPDNGIWVQIDNGDGSFTSMPKSVYDEQQAAAKDAAN